MTTILDARLEELHKEFREALARFRENILLAHRPMMVTDPGKLDLEQLKPGRLWRAYRGEWDGDEAVFGPPEPMRAWAIHWDRDEKHPYPKHVEILIGTRADADASAAQKAGGSVTGPYEFTIAVKP